MACARTRQKCGARCNVRRLVSGGVGEIATVAGRGSSQRGDVSPPQNILHLFVTLLIELLGERVRERDQVDGFGGRRSTRSGGGCHTGDVKTAASASGTQGSCDAAAGALADKMPLRQTSGGDRTGPDAGGCHQAQRLAPPVKTCHTRAGWYLRLTPCGRTVPEPVWRAAARGASESAQPCRVAAAGGSGCHGWGSPRKARTEAARRACESASRPTGRRRPRRPERGGRDPPEGCRRA